MSPGTKGPQRTKLSMAGGKVIKDNRGKARATQRLAGMGTDIAGATGNQDGTRAHDQLPSLSIISKSPAPSWPLNCTDHIPLGDQLFKIGNGLGQTFSERDGGTPAKHLFGLADVGAPLLRIILRQRPMHDLRA